MKALVSTKGDFMLMDPSTSEIVYEARPSVVTWSYFLESRTGAGQIEVHQADLPDTATDAEFEEFWVASDREQALAVDSYLSSFAPVEPEPEPEPEPPATGKAAK